MTLAKIIILYYNIGVGFVPTANDYVAYSIFDFSDPKEIVFVQFSHTTTLTPGTRRYLAIRPDTRTTEISTGINIGKVTISYTHTWQKQLDQLDGYRVIPGFLTQKNKISVAFSN